MTLPVSGAISLNQVNVELGIAGTTTISLNQSNLRTLFGVGSGAITMSNGYGKANAFGFAVASNVTNANLRTLAVNAGWTGTSALTCTLNSGIYFISSAVGTAGLTINGSFPNGVTFVNNGIVVGDHGDGGGGAGWAGSGGGGGAGGLALLIQSAVSIRNNGTIAGGGGGGGGGGSARGTNNNGDIYYPVSGGSGGRGKSVSGPLGGSGGQAVTQGKSTFRGGTGGTGGQWGASGGAGGGGSGNAQGGGGRPGGAGGGGGAATSGQSSVTWLATGTRYGSLG